MMTLEEDPTYREYEAAKLLRISPRTIQRQLITGEFPKPDSRIKVGKFRRPIWRLSTLRAYLQSRRVAA